MQAATADALTGMPIPADMIANNQDDQPENQVYDDDLVGEMMIGFDKLRRMSHNELRNVIGTRLSLLGNELRGRAERREAIDTAQLASHILDFRCDHGLIRQPATLAPDESQFRRPRGHLRICGEGQTD